jgi:hypothetical protein
MVPRRMLLSSDTKTRARLVQRANVERTTSLTPPDCTTTVSGLPSPGRV